jgi:outer membrane protein
MKQHRKGCLEAVLVVILLIINSNVRSQTAPVSLKQAINMALSNNDGLKADSMNMLTAGFQKNVAKADNLPQVSYSSRTEYNPAIASQMLPGKIVDQPDKDYVPVQFGTRYGMSHGVEVMQNLFRQDTRLKISAAELNTRIARTKHTLTKEELIYQVAAAYYELQTSAEMIRTTTKDYHNLVQIVHISEAQVQNGTLKRIDLESLQISAANKESQLNQLQSKYDVQVSYFKYLLGIPVHEGLVIETNTIGLPHMPVAVNEQLSKRTDLFLNRQLIEAKELELKSIRAERLPVTSAFFRFNYQSQYNDAGDAFKNDYWFKSSVIGLSTKITLFDGYRRRNRLNIAKSQLQQLKFDGEQQQRLANTEWITANEKLNNDLKQHQITGQNLTLAEKVFISRKALYAEGVSSLIELLDADRELSQARNNHTQATINVQTGLLDAHKANGTLLTEFLSSQK